MADVNAALSGSTPSVIEGTTAADTLTSLATNDYMSGGDGSDVYNFTLGDGRDVISDKGHFDTDQIALHGYAPGDVSLSKIGDTGDLRISFSGTDDELYVIGTVSSTYGTIRAGQIEQIVFDDGTVWSEDLIRNKALAAHTTSGNDAVYGTYYADTLSGGTGSDYLSGGRDSDVYDFTLGDGKDVIDDNGYRRY